jgi:hypothetical protein
MTILAQARPQYQYFDKAGVQFYIGSHGAIYLTQTGLSKICEVSRSTITRKTGRPLLISPLTAQVLVPQRSKGFSTKSTTSKNDAAKAEIGCPRLQDVLLYDELAIIEALKKFNPDRVDILTQVALREMFQKIAVWNPEPVKEFCLYQQRMEAVKADLMPKLKAVIPLIRMVGREKVAELQKGKKVFECCGCETKFICVPGESQEQQEQRIAEYWKSKGYVYSEEEEDWGRWEYEHGEDVDDSDYEYFEWFENDLDLALTELQAQYRYISDHAIELIDNYASVIDERMLEELGICLDLTGTLRSTCLAFEAANQINQMVFEDLTPVEDLKLTALEQLALTPAK